MHLLTCKEPRTLVNKQKFPTGSSTYITRTQGFDAGNDQYGLGQALVIGSLGPTGFFNVKGLLPFKLMPGLTRGLPYCLSLQKLRAPTSTIAEAYLRTLRSSRICPLPMQPITAANII